MTPACVQVDRLIMSYFVLFKHGEERGGGRLKIHELKMRIEQSTDKILNFINYYY